MAAPLSQKRAQKRHGGMAALSVCHCQAHLDHGVSGEENAWGRHLGQWTGRDRVLWTWDPLGRCWDPLGCWMSDKLQMLKAFRCFPEDLLTDIARRENLKLGPNRQMQDLWRHKNGTFLLDLGWLLGHVLLQFGLFEGANGSEKRTGSGSQPSHVDWNSARGEIAAAARQLWWFDNIWFCRFWDYPTQILDHPNGIDMNWPANTGHDMVLHARSWHCLPYKTISKHVASIFFRWRIAFRTSMRTTRTWSQRQASSSWQPQSSRVLDMFWSWYLMVPDGPLDVWGRNGVEHLTICWVGMVGVGHWGCAEKKNVELPKASIRRLHGRILTKVLTKTRLTLRSGKCSTKWTL